MPVDKQLESLKSIMVENARTAATNLENWDPRTLMGMKSRVRGAQDAAEALTVAYETALAQRAVLVVLQGSSERTDRVVAAVAAEDVLAVRADGLYRELAKGVDSSIDARRTFGPGQAARLVEELTEYARSNGIRELPLPKMDINDFNAPTATFEDVVAVIRKAVRATAGDDLNAVVLKRKAITAAVQQGVVEPILPIVLHGVTMEESKTLPAKIFAGRPVISINLDMYSDDKTLVEDVLRRITSEFKSLNAAPTSVKF